MTPFDCYQDFIAVRCHLTSEKYNYKKYNGKIGAKISSYNKRKDIYFFEKMSKLQDPHGTIVANILVEPAIQPRALCSETSSKNYNNWVRRTQSISNTFRRDISALDMSFKNNFTIKEHNHPHLLKLYLQEKISLETFALICKITKCSARWDEVLKDDYMWKEIRLTVEKYPDLLEYDMSKLFDLLKEQFA